MLKLIWTVATLTVQGPLVTDVPESTTFRDAAACVAFGEAMAPRVADWVRGAIRTDWEHEVGVTFRCEPDDRAA
jgi:hypothetical protein